MKPIISFCISTYKRDDRLIGVIESILSQKITNLEIVITDNDVDSVTDKIIGKFRDKRIRYYKNPHDIGMVQSFNRALSLARGKFITFITDDDPLYSCMASELLNLAKQYPEAKAFFGACCVNIEDRVISNLYNAKPGRNLFLSNSVPVDTVRVYSSEGFFTEFLHNRIFPYFLWSCGIVDRKLALDIGGMPDYGSPYLTDFGYVLLAGSSSGAITLNKALGEQTIHTSNFGRIQFADLIMAVEGFNKYLFKKFVTRIKVPAIIPKLKEIDEFSSRWLVNHLLFVNKYQVVLGSDLTELRNFNNVVFATRKYMKFKMPFYFHLFLFRIKRRLSNAK